MPNPIVHFELMGPDGDSLKAFYEDLFDWQLDQVPGFDSYYTVEGDTIGGVGGAVGQGPEHGPTYLTVYLEVDSIDDHLARVEAAGGQTVTPRTVIPDTVIFALFTDPAGNMVGLVEADSSAEPG